MDENLHVWAIQWATRGEFKNRYTFFDTELERDEMYRSLTVRNEKAIEIIRPVEMVIRVETDHDLIRAVQEVD